MNGAAQNSTPRRPSPGKLARRIRFFCLILTLGHALFLAGLPLLLSLAGERNPASAFALYLPPALWLLPLAPLLLPALFWRRVLLCWCAAAIAGVLGLFPWLFDSGGGSAPMRKEALNEVLVMTHNQGQQGRDTLDAFLRQVSPDFLVLQEASKQRGRSRAGGGAEDFPHSESWGEFTLLSRFPILSVAPVATPTGQGRKMRAARFAVDWRGREISIYSVHLRTPRDVLEYQGRGAFLYGLVGLPGTPLAEKRRQGQRFWDGQMADARALLEAARADPNPVILAGDFNAPDAGHIHRMLTRELADAHAESGKGHGYTFPGTTSNPLSAGGPWLRIDYIFCGPQWRTVSCLTESGRGSQHLAVAARLAFKN